MRRIVGRENEADKGLKEIVERCKRNSTIAKVKKRVQIKMIHFNDIHLSKVCDIKSEQYIQ